MMEIGQIIYEESNENIIEYIGVEGVWALYGIKNDESEYKCLNVGKCKDVGKEILHDLACLRFIKDRNDGDIEYRNQFNEYCGFKYKRNQVREYLYPYIAKNFHSLKFVYIFNKSDSEFERMYAYDSRAIFWRNGAPFGVKKIKDNI